MPGSGALVAGDYVLPLLGAGIPLDAPAAPSAQPAPAADKTALTPQVMGRLQAVPAVRLCLGSTLVVPEKVRR